MGVFRFFRRAQWDDERANELEDSLARERDDNIARGMTPDEAGDAARRKLGNRTRIREEIYVPYTSRATEADRRVPAAMTLMVRTTLDRAPTDALIRRVVSSLSQEVPVSQVKTMDNSIADAVATPASTAVRFAAFAGLALLLGVVGVYGVVSFLASKRTQEIGIRLALGARAPGDPNRSASHACTA
jgi:hypothetical protein